MALAENSGHSAIETVTDLKAKQIQEKNPYLGVDCLNMGNNGDHLHCLFEHSDFRLKKCRQTFFKSGLCEWVILLSSFLRSEYYVFLCHDGCKHSSSLISDMREQKVIESLLSKRAQFSLATQVRQSLFEFSFMLL